MKNKEELIEDLKAEKAEITMRATSLDRFVEDHGTEVSKRQHHAMREQQSAMWAYVHALGERIEDMVRGDSSD